MTPRIWDLPLAAVDVETTGLDPRAGHRVIEVAVVRGRWGETPARYSTLVQPGRPVAATEIHGITDDMLAGAPRWTEVAPLVDHLLESAVFVAHNARFDLGFLAMERHRAGLAPRVVEPLDTLGLARASLRIERHGLTHVLAHLGIARARAHRAEDDALATWEAAWRMLEQVDPGRRLGVGAACALGRRHDVVARRGLVDELRARIGQPTLIEYAGTELTQRAITPQRVSQQKVEAWCHLREAERVFRVDRIRVLGDPAA
jgi:DNA polymerase III epsilon subunit family exonuclease